MDYEEEQQNELMLLESIFYDTYTLIDSDPIKFTVKTDIYEEGAEAGEDEDSLATLTLEFTFPATYPEVAPGFRVADCRGVKGAIIDSLTPFVENLAEENMGTAMTFTMIDAIKEMLVEKLGEDNADEEGAGDAPKAKSKGKGKSVATGIIGTTEVTKENFVTWKKEFDRKRLEAEKKVEKTQPEKLTGRQLFERDNSLITSDSALIDEGDEVADLTHTLGALEVDAELFNEDDLEDLDDLDDIE